MNENDDIIAAKLDELIAATKATNVPLSARWLDAAGIGALLGFSARNVAERIACRPDFPKPFRLDGHGRPRWKASEVQDWIESQRRARAA